MTQKERAILALKSIIIMHKDKTETIHIDFLIEKMNACLELQRPEILLSEEERKKFNELVEFERRRGKII